MTQTAAVGGVISQAVVISTEHARVKTVKSCGRERDKVSVLQELQIFPLNDVGEDGLAPLVFPLQSVWTTFIRDLTHLEYVGCIADKVVTENVVFVFAQDVGDIDNLEGHGGVKQDRKYSFNWEE